MRAEIHAGVRPGWFQGPTSLTFTSDFTTDVLRYTTNGSEPTPSRGFVYSDPIPIAHTTVIRIAAFRENAQPGAVRTFTYLNATDVLDQTGKGFPAHWGTTNGVPVRADYAMDPEVVGDGAQRDAVRRGLEALPVVSLVADLEDLFGEKTGVYANPLATGDAWERRASLEILFPDARGNRQVSCGLRIQGGWNRRPEESPKHAFRVVFRKRYGESDFKVNLFGEREERFDTLILRAGCNNTWLHWSGEERARGEYIRDQWMRDSYAAMGQLSARGLFVHLYLNGLYWGLYNLVERPSAPFLALHLGGRPSDYDSRNGENILEGDDRVWRNLFRRLNAGVPDDAALKEVAGMLDLDAFADYMLLNLYGANGDWDRVSNWYAGRRRNPEGRYVFLVWDGERNLEKVSDSILTADDDFSPTRVFQRLRENAGFRKLFAERARRHLGAGGALDPVNAAQRYKRWADRLDGAILAESARWGDYRRDVHSYKVGPYDLYTRDKYWRPEVQRLLQDYFPKRTEALTRQLTEVGLYGDPKPKRTSRVKASGVGHRRRQGASGRVGAMPDPGRARRSSTRCRGSVSSSRGRDSPD